MRSIRYLLLLLSVVACQMLSAQSNCYETTRMKGVELYNQGDLQAAAKNFEAAKFCADLPDNNDLDSWLEKCVIVVKLTPKRLEFEATDNEEQTVEVNTKAKSFKVSNAPSWCTVTQQGKYLNVNCEDNVQVSPREAKITVTAAGKTAVLDIYQASADLEVEFQPESVVFSSQNETKTVKVVTNVPDWAIESSPSWLVSERKDDTLLLACNKNTSPDIREDEVVIQASGETFPLRVRQMPGDTLLQVSKNEMVFEKDFKTARLGVVCNMSSWEVESEDRWIDVARQNDSLQVAVMENQSVFSRHGKVRVRCGSRYVDVTVHQKPHVSSFTMPASEIKSNKVTANEVIKVTSYPSDLKVYIDDSIAKTTPFDYVVDYEHHSLLVGFERHEYLFNDKQEDIVYNPGLRFASITFTAPKNIGLRTGFIAANHFGAFSHFMASRPLVKEYPLDTAYKADGYHFLVGPVYSPIQYAAIYAGVGIGIHQGPTLSSIPNIGLDYEAGVMGLFKNATVSVGFRRSKWGTGPERGSTTFVLGVGGYLKRYYDKDLGYCSSDSRRWWSINYMMRPATKGKGVMFSDLGKAKTRYYLKGMYSQPADSTSRVVDAAFGVVFTPVNGIIDFCLGAGAGYDFMAKGSLPTIEAEAGFILNIWRIPLTVMLHESDLIHQNNRRLYVDFGVGIHLGEFKRSSYK